MLLDRIITTKYKERDSCVLCSTQAHWAPRTAMSCRVAVLAFALSLVALARGVHIRGAPDAPHRRDGSHARRTPHAHATRRSLGLGGGVWRAQRAAPARRPINAGGQQRSTLDVSSLTTIQIKNMLRQ